MADPISLDSPSITLGGTDISQWVATANLTVTHTTTGVPNTWGNDGPRRRVGDKYDFQLELDLVSDGWDAGDLDAIVTALMPSPSGIQHDRRGRGGSDEARQWGGCRREPVVHFQRCYR